MHRPDVPSSTDGVDASPTVQRLHGDFNASNVGQTDRSTRFESSVHAIDDRM